MMSGPIVRLDLDDAFHGGFHTAMLCLVSFQFTTLVKDSSHAWSPIGAEPTQHLGG